MLKADTADFLFHSSFKGSTSKVSDHIRHVVDHYLILIHAADGQRQACIDYDKRARDVSIAQNISVAKEILLQVIEQLNKFTELSSDHPLTVTYSTSLNEDSVKTPSSLGRELQFIHSHTIHHLALISMIARSHDIPLPKDLGIAPSTLKNIQDQQCVA